MNLLLGALGGIAAALIGLGVAEVVASLSQTFQSPVLDVADRVVDGVPNWLKELAIAWFGTSDKIALLVGIGSILTASAAIVGILALGRQARWTMAGIALFGFVGAYASQSTRRAAPLSARDRECGWRAGGRRSVHLLHRVARRGLEGSPAAVESIADGTTGSAGQRHATIAELVPNDHRRFLAAAGLLAAGGVVLGATGRDRR